ncbi:MAG: hypothetical protein BWY85_01745 [Firmicutes bacterium ADurb.Bin506]|nr:MAG: hypothetical protein BWY85_01745 [Firmicutes bacterium ADurb.Bin506]
MTFLPISGWAASSFATMLPADPAPTISTEVKEALIGRGCPFPFLLLRSSALIRVWKRKRPIMPAASMYDTSADPRDQVNGVRATSTRATRYAPLTPQATAARSRTVAYSHSR